MEALKFWQSVGDRLRMGETQRWISRLQWFSGRSAEARAAAEAAIEVLESLSAGRELAMAYSNQAQLKMLSGETEDAIAWGTRAISLAEKVGDVVILSHALNNVGTTEWLAHDDHGLEKLKRSLQIARRHNLEEHIARALTNLSSCAV